MRRFANANRLAPRAPINVLLSGCSAAWLPAAQRLYCLRRRDLAQGRTRCAPQTLMGARGTSPSHLPLYRLSLQHLQHFAEQPLSCFRFHKGMAGAGAVAQAGVSLVPLGEEALRRAVAAGQ